jgi:hypothetical protein
VERVLHAALVKVRSRAGFPRPIALEPPVPYREWPDTAPEPVEA